MTHVRFPFRIDSAEPTLNSAALVMALPLHEGDEISQSRQVRTCIGTRQASSGRAASEALYRSDIRCRIVLVPLGTPAARAKHERLAPSLACAHSEMPGFSNVHFVTFGVADIDGHDPISLCHRMLIWFRVVAHSLHPAARSHVNDSLNIFTDNFTESERAMLQTDITMLEKRQKALEKEIGEALTHAPIDDPMVADLKSRVLYVKDEIDRLRHEAFVLYH